jgi:hypothetical protein
MAMAGAVIFAIGLLVVAGMSTDTSNNDSTAGAGDTVERLTPPPDDQALRQTPIALDLATGWGLAELVVNGTPILEQDWDVTPELGLYQFTPGPDTSLEQLKADENCVRAQIFQLADPTQRDTVNWCFTVV